MRRVVLVSAHDVRSKRRAGFHWLADAYRRLGWHVTFVTVGFSWLSHIRRDHRFALTSPDRRNRPETVAWNLMSYVWFTPYHPANRLPAFGNLLLAPLFKGYHGLPMPDLEPLVAQAELVVFESTSGLMLVERLRGWNSRARFVYRVSDDLRLLRAHPLVIEAERRTLDRFDLVSVPSEYILRLFEGRSNVALQYHGLDTAAFERATETPYQSGRDANAVFVGTSYLDTDFLDVAARDHPGWDFHVIGPLPRLPHHPNLIRHGEIPFADTVPYLQHADVGLSPLRYRPGVESMTDNLKVIQYTYCRLPIVAPAFLQSSRPNVVAYHPGDSASIGAALATARSFNRSTIDVSGIGSWEDLAAKLAGGAAP